jgi:hypothetical protein
MRDRSPRPAAGAARIARSAAPRAHRRREGDAGDARGIAHLHHRLTDLRPLLGADLRLGAATRLTGLTLLGASLALLCAGLSLISRALQSLVGVRPDRHDHVVGLVDGGRPSLVRCFSSMAEWVGLSAAKRLRVAWLWRARRAASRRNGPQPLLQPLCSRHRLFGLRRPWPVLPD